MVRLVDRGLGQAGIGTSKHSWRGKLLPVSKRLTSLGRYIKSYCMLSGFKLSSLFIPCCFMHRASVTMSRNQALVEAYIADDMVIELKWISQTTANISRMISSCLNDCWTHSSG